MNELMLILVALLMIITVWDWLCRFAEYLLQPSEVSPIKWRPHHPTVVMVASIVGLTGFVVRVQDPETFDSRLWSFIVDLAPEMVGFAFTVVVIDELGERRAERLEKERIIEQMGSPVNDVALEAVRIARKSDWLRDGSLRGANLVEPIYKGLTWNVPTCKGLACG